MTARVVSRNASLIACVMRGYVPQHWPAGMVPHLVDFDGPPVGPFAASHDLDGDGELLLVPTPGHTPGHAGLLIRAGGRQMLLAGDLVHAAAELDRAAPDLGAWALAERVAVLAAHDPDAARLIAALDTAGLSLDEELL